MVTFDVPDDESTGSNTLCDSEESEDEESAETQNPTSQNNEADARLVHAAWLRKTSDNVYMSNRKSMNLRTYIHAAHQRTETVAPLDSGATPVQCQWIDKQVRLHQILYGSGDADGHQMNQYVLLPNRYGRTQSVME